MTNNDWCVAVFKCTPENIRNVLVGFYGFMKDLEGVKSLHFLIKDRVKNEIIVSFRVLVTEKTRKIVQSKMNYKLGILVPDKFAVDPDTQNPLKKYVAWDTEKRISQRFSNIRSCQGFESVFPEQSLNAKSQNGGATGN